MTTTESPSPSPSPTETTATTTVTCDPAQALYDVGDGSGCVILLAPGPIGQESYDVALAEEWMVPAVFFAVIVVVCLVALAVAQLRKG